MSIEAPNNPYIDRLVGKNIENEAEKWHKEVIDLVEHVGAEDIEGYELPKTPKDLEIIAFAEQAVDDMMSSYGRTKTIAVPINNIHILKPGGTDEFTKGKFSNGAASNSQKSMIVDRVESDREFAAIIFHEMVHLKSYSAMQVIDGERIEKYRAGISVYSRDYSELYLSRLEEIIVLYLESEFVRLHVNDLSVSDGQEKEALEGIDNMHRSSKMNTLVELLFENNTGKFNNKEEIVHLLVDAQVNGNLLAVSGLLKDTYGPDALKKIDFVEIE